MILLLEVKSFFNFFETMRMKIGPKCLERGICPHQQCFRFYNLHYVILCGQMLQLAVQ